MFHIFSILAYAHFPNFNPYYPTTYVRVYYSLSRSTVTSFWRVHLEDIYYTIRVIGISSTVWKSLKSYTNPQKKQLLAWVVQKPPLNYFLKKVTVDRDKEYQYITTLHVEGWLLDGGVVMNVFFFCECFFNFTKILTPTSK